LQHNVIGATNHARYPEFCCNLSPVGMASSLYWVVFRVVKVPFISRCVCSDD